MPDDHPKQSTKKKRKNKRNRRRKGGKKSAQSQQSEHPKVAVAAPVADPAMYQSRRIIQGPELSPMDLFGAPPGIAASQPGIAGSQPDIEAPPGISGSQIDIEAPPGISSPKVTTSDVFPQGMEGSTISDTFPELLPISEPEFPEITSTPIDPFELLGMEGSSLPPPGVESPAIVDEAPLGFGFGDTEGSGLLFGFGEGDLSLFGPLEEMDASFEADLFGDSWVQGGAEPQEELQEVEAIVSRPSSSFGEFATDYIRHLVPPRLVRPQRTHLMRAAEVGQICSQVSRIRLSDPYYSDHYYRVCQVERKRKYAEASGSGSGSRKRSCIPGSAPKIDCFTRRRFFCSVIEFFGETLGQIVRSNAFAPQPVIDEPTVPPGMPLVPPTTTAARLENLALISLFLHDLETIERVERISYRQEREETRLIVLNQLLSLENVSTCEILPDDHPFVLLLKYPSGAFTIVRYLMHASRHTIDIVQQLLCLHSDKLLISDAGKTIPLLMHTFGRWIERADPPDIIQLCSIIDEMNDDVFKKYVSAPISMLYLKFVLDIPDDASEAEYPQKEVVIHILNRLLEFVRESPHATTVLSKVLSESVPNPARTEWRRIIAEGPVPQIVMHRKKQGRSGTRRKR